MQKIVLRYGCYGLIVIVALLLITFFLFGDSNNIERQEVIGYVSIVTSLLFVYFAIRQWRDRYNNGVLTFGKGMAIGTLITLFPSFAFGLFSWLYMAVLEPGQNGRDFQHYVEKIKQQAPAEKLAAALEKVNAEKEMFNNPLMQFVVMFLTVFMIGMIITVISTMILRRKRAMAAG